MSNNKDFKVKNGIKPTAYQETLGTVVSGSESYNFSSFAYDNSSLVLTGRNLNDLALKSDGTRIYYIDNNGYIRQRSLSTAYDLSTAGSETYFDQDAQDSDPRAVTFKTDGTKMYFTGSASSRVYQYTLSTAWDVTTASYDSKNFHTSSQTGSPYSTLLKSDGTKMYISGGGVLYEYSLSTAWDVSTASYTSNSFTFTSQDSLMEGMFFKPDGTKLYTVGTNNDKVYIYNFGTAFDLSTLSYSNNSYALSSGQTAPKGIVISADGTKTYIADYATTTIWQYSSALSTAQLDLSTGSVFDYTPTSNAQVTLTNPAASGTASGATLLLGSEDSTGVGSTFSTTLYTGNSSTQTITNGIDLAGDGGMVWGKSRSIVDNHWIVDSENGIGSNGTYNYLEPSLTTALRNFGDRSVKTFNSNGFTLANSTNDQFNLSTATYVSWTFKKKTKFFDIVTYTGTGVTDRTVSHNLGSSPGMVIVKRTNGSDSWLVLHRSRPSNNYFLNLTSTASGDMRIKSMDSTSFTLNIGQVNENGETYVAYLFAHDTDASSLIKCGGYTGTGATGNNVTLGWEPQWLMIKNTTSGVRPWIMIDTKRGTTNSGSDQYLKANASDAEDTDSYLGMTSTGFQLQDTGGNVNASGENFIYMAIRSPSVPTVTYDSSLKWSGGTAPTLPATGEKDVITFNTTDGGTTYKSALAIDGAK